MEPEDINSRLPRSTEEKELTRVQNELKRLQAENLRLAAERRAVDLENLRNALIGKLPGAIIDALVEWAEVVDTAITTQAFASGRLAARPLAFARPVGAARFGQQCTVIQRLITIADSMPLRVGSDSPNLNLSDWVIKEMVEAIRRM